MLHSTCITYVASSNFVTINLHINYIYPSICFGGSAALYNNYVKLGFENRERTYRNFPEALLHWKVALEIVRVDRNVIITVIMAFFLLGTAGV